MRRVNWPFVWIVVIGLTAALSIAFLWGQFWVPRPIRHWYGDFGAVAFVTMVATCVVNLVTTVGFRENHSVLATIIHMVPPVASLPFWLWVEFEDFLGIEDEGCDPGCLLEEWFGRPEEDVFDWGDMAAVFLGGLLVIHLQLRST